MKSKNTFTRYKPFTKHILKIYTKPHIIITALIAMLLLIYLNNKLHFQNLELMYNTDNKILTDFTQLTNNNIYQCIYPRLKGKHFLTPLNKIENTIQECYTPLQARINKIPLSTLQITIPAPRVIALLYNPVTNHYGLLLSQDNKTTPYLLGKPAPERFIELIHSKQYNTIEINSYPTPVCCNEFIIKLTATLNKYADLTPYRLVIVNKPQKLGYAKLTLPDDSSIFFNYQADIDDQLQKFLITYKGLRQKNITYSYIDLRFDRVIIK